VESFTDGKDCRTYDATIAGGLNVVASSTSTPAAASNSTEHALCLHELNDFYPVVGSRRRQGDGMFVGGACQVLFADGHVAKIKDEGGFQNGPDGWIGPFKVGGFTSAEQLGEVRAELLDLPRFVEIWLKDLGTSDAAGAGGGDG